MKILFVKISVWMIKITIKPNEIDMSICFFQNNITYKTMFVPIVWFFSSSLLVYDFYPYRQTWYQQGPVKLIKRVKIAHSFLQSVKSVPSYHFKLVFVVLHMAVKVFLEAHF